LPGNHGWDNLNSEMSAMFVAQGPSFKKKTEVHPFHNIDLYNLMCAMMGVDPSPNNGTWVSRPVVYFKQSSMAILIVAFRFLTFRALCITC
jgi:hypothetical protein